MRTVMAADFAVPVLPTTAVVMASDANVMPMLALHVVRVGAVGQHSVVLIVLDRLLIVAGVILCKCSSSSYKD
jgi:hypothetical protein